MGQEGWPLRYIFNYALACTARTSTTSRRRCREGPNVRPEIERFLRRLGYRLVLKELKHPAVVKAGDKLDGHEMAEHGLGPLLPALPPGLSAQRLP